MGRRYGPGLKYETREAWQVALRKRRVQYYERNRDKVREKSAQWIAANREKARDNVNRWTAANRLHQLINSARHRALKKGRDFSITVESLQARFDKGVCERSCIPFDFSPGKSWRSPSLDRIDSTKGYTADNVQLVIWAYNGAKQEFADADVEMLAFFLTRRARERRYPPPQTIEPCMVQLEFPFEKTRVG